MLLVIFLTSLFEKNVNSIGKVLSQTIPKNNKTNSRQEATNGNSGFFFFIQTFIDVNNI